MQSAGVEPSVDFERVFEAAVTPLAVVTTDHVFAAVNAAYCEATGRRRDELLGKALFDVFPDNPDAEESARLLRSSIDEAIATGSPQLMALQRYDVEVPDTGFAERYWSVTNSPVFADDGSVTFVLIHPEEVTQFVAQRLEREQTEAPQGAGTTAAVETVFTAALSRLRFLNDLAAALVGADTIEQVARALLRDGLGLAGAVAGSVIIDDRGRFVMIGQHNVDTVINDEWSVFPVSAGAEPFSDAVLSGEPQFFGDAATFVAAYPHLADRIDAEHRAWAVLPFRHGDATLGALGLIYDVPTEFSSVLRLTLYTINSLASQAIARAQLLAEQQTILDSIDDALLQLHVDEVHGLRVDAIYEPAAHVTSAGGDWYDVVALDDDTVLIVVGDVANHGTVAVGEMAKARALLRAIALDTHDPEVIAAKVSNSTRRFSTTFATAIVAVYTASTRSLVWTSAGHPPALLLAGDASSPAEVLDAPHGPPLGVAARYRSSRRTVEPGDTVLMYTDGLVERRREPFDESFERLRSLVDSSPSTPTCRWIFDQLHPGGHNLDDVAVLAVTFDPTTQRADARA